MSRSLAVQHLPFRAAKGSARNVIIGNAVPKSGTYLLNNLIKVLGGWQDIQVHLGVLTWIDKSGATDKSHWYPTDRLLRRLRNGQLVAAHLPYSEDLAAEILRPRQNREIKHLFMFRDPRDVYVSMANFIANNRNSIDRSAKWSGIRDDALSNSQSAGDVLSYVIDTWPNGMSMQAYEPWLDSPAAHAIRFESLYEDVLALQGGHFGPTISALFDAIDVDSAALEPRQVFSAFFNKGLTASAQTDKVGQWKARFEPRHFEALDTPEFRHLLKSFGYD